MIFAPFAMIGAAVIVILWINILCRSARTHNITGGFG